MDVSYTNFVKININHHLTTAADSERDTAVLFNFLSNMGSEVDTTYESLSEYAGVTTNDLYKYLQIFFANGGRKIRVIPILKSQTTQADFVEAVTALPMEQIVISYCDSTTNGDVSETVFRGYAQAYQPEDKVYTKIFVARIADGNLSNYKGSDAVSIENYVLKYGAIGIECTVLAYLTKIKVYEVDSTKDYMFTLENLDETPSAKYVYNDNDIVKDIIDNNYNVDTILIREIRNVGGNDTKGYDLINQFMLILVHQTVTSRLVQLLVNKIKYDSNGISKVICTISQELENYINNGYLATNKIWTDEDLYYKGYEIINKDTPITNGYKIVVLPFSSLSAADKAAHKLPEIYILLADSYSIRKIEISGEVF